MGHDALGQNRVAKPVWRELHEPRGLTEHEHELLVVLVRATGDDALVSQAAGAVVRGECLCGCPSVRLSTDGPAMSAGAMRRVNGGGRDNYVGVTAAAPALGDTAEVEVTVHVVAGLLEELEIFGGEGIAVPVPRVAALTDVHVGT